MGSRGETDDGDRGIARLFRGRFVRTFLVAFALLVLVGELWSLATPVNGAPDERNHLTKAAAVIRGQWTGQSVQGAPDAYTRVRVPQVYTSPGVGDCEVGHPTVPVGGCTGRTGSARTVSAVTYVGHYPPLYYLLIGWPTALGNRMSIYLVRMMSVIVNAVFLALAAAVALTWSRSRLMLSAVFVAVTPMVIFLAGVVNPSGLEISAAIAMWTAAVVLVVDHPRRPPTGLLAVLCAATCVELLVRGDTMLWPALCVLVLLPLAWGRLDWRALAGRRDVRTAGGVTALSAAGGLLWLALGKPLAVVPLGVPKPGTPGSTLVRQIVGSGPAMLNQSIGVFGWLDTRAPALTYLIWYGLLGAMAAVVLLVGRRRALLSAGVSLVLSALVPLVMCYLAIRHTGSIQQGRYFLALAVSVPIVCGALTSQVGLPAAATTRLATSIPIFAGTGQVAAGYWALRRYTVGTTGPLSPIASVPGVWHPPLPAWTLDLGFLVVWAALAVVAALGVRSLPVRAASPRSDVADEAPPGVPERAQEVPSTSLASGR